jgi:FkbM family methyltransferase
MLVKPLAYRILRRFGTLDWLRTSIRYRTLRLLVPPGGTNSFDFTVDFYGMKYRGNLNSYIDWMVYFFGAYEKDELHLLRDLILEREDPVFVDVGANVGQHSIFMSRFCACVQAFEPYERVRRIFEEKISLNNISNINVNGLGLGERDEELEFFAPTGWNSATGTFVADHDESNNRPFTNLRVVNGDEYLTGLKLNKVDLIKIDVEGFERAVLIGLKNTLRKYRPIVFMEFSDSTRKTFSSYEELRSLLPENYSISKIVPDTSRHVFFNTARCRLLAFDFDAPGGNILMRPLEPSSSAATSARLTSDETSLRS